MLYYELRRFGVWRPRTTDTYLSPPTGEDVRHVATVKAEHAHLNLTELQTIYGNEAKEIEAAEKAAAVLQEKADGLAAPEPVAPFSASDEMNRVMAKLGLNHLGKAVPGELMQNTLFPVLVALTDRVLAMEALFPQLVGGKIEQVVEIEVDQDGIPLEPLPLMLRDSPVEPAPQAEYLPSFPPTTDKMRYLLRMADCALKGSIRNLSGSDVFWFEGEYYTIKWLQKQIEVCLLGLQPGGLS